jgi:uncharacterized protein (TIGR03067 family)
MSRVPMAIGILALFAVSAFADPAGDEAKKLEGTWVAHSATLDGKAMEGVKSWQLVFAGNKLVLKMGDGIEDKYAFKVDPSRKPKWMDFDPEKKKPNANIGVAIYELDGDTLKICVGAQGERPTEFTDKAGPMIILKRKK